jgi:hypothetical protein
MKALYLREGEKMAKVSAYYTGAQAEYFVDPLPFPERSTCHHGFLTSVECL